MDPKTINLRAFHHLWPLLVLAAALLTGGGYAAYAQDGGNPSDAAPPASAAAMEPVALEELLAPIALYPDALLGAMFAAAAHPQEVMDAGNWRLENPALEGPALDTAAEKAGFGPGTRALLTFPTVLDMMCQNFDWTQQLGAAFNADQGALMAAAQRLRAQALAAGNLASSPEQQVEQRTINEQQVVEIRPTTPTQVYVPQYNPEAVYTQPASAPVQYVAVPGAPGVTQVVAGPSTGDLIAAGVIGFTTAVIIANIFNQNRYPATPTTATPTRAGASAFSITTTALGMPAVTAIILIMAMAVIGTVIAVGGTITRHPTTRMSGTNLALGTGHRRAIAPTQWSRSTRPR